MFDEKKVSIEIGGKTLKASTGKYARQAGGAVFLEYGETAILTTATRSKEPRKGANFFPLTVDFIEKYYAAGKFPGGFNKREARPTTNATLIARLIDRPIRPMFPDGFNFDVHIVNTVMSYDGECKTDFLGILGSSLALGLSDLPFLGPIAGVIVGLKDGNFILNPTPEELKESELDLTVAGTKEAINMVEAGADEVSEEVMLKAIAFAHENIKKLCIFQEELIKVAGKENFVFEKEEISSVVKDYIDANVKDKMKEATVIIGKKARQDALDKLQAESLEAFSSGLGENFIEELEGEFKTYFHSVEKELVRSIILYDKHRADGRKTDEIRPLYAETNFLKAAHGSSMFTRGETQAIVSTTLGTKVNEQLIDGLEEEFYKKFYLHYNFPPYSVGEVGFLRAPGRRELGHGSLAERALSYVLPKVEDFPYTIRVVSEITESNGSSSQASICGGSLALMAAGVPIRSHVAGIAMGLIKEGSDYVVLTDIQGLEDHLGDMDFKVAGTRKGITALQMDIKITGLDNNIMTEALEQALKARNEILTMMEETIATPNELAPHVPRIHQIIIPVDKISALIGPGGKNIKGIIETTGATIDIEDDGRVSIASSNGEMLEMALELINNYVKDVEIGEIYRGKVVKVTTFGAFMEILPGKEGLLHVSEISHERVAKVEDVLKEGDSFDVKIISLDKGKISLSKKKIEKKVEAPSES